MSQLSFLSFKLHLVARTVKTGGSISAKIVGEIAEVVVLSELVVLVWREVIHCSETAYKKSKSL